MNPELERLLAALEAQDNAVSEDFPTAAAEVERLLAPILERLSPIGRADFLRALQGRYRAYLKGSSIRQRCRSENPKLRRAAALQRLMRLGRDASPFPIFWHYSRFTRGVKSVTRMADGTGIPFLKFARARGLGMRNSRSILDLRGVSRLTLRSAGS